LQPVILKAKARDPKAEVQSRSRILIAPQKATQKFLKIRRLLRHADFDRVYKKGRRHFAKHMTVFYMRKETANDEGERPNQMRIGFTVRRVLGGAVERNRMRRRLREAVRLQATLPEDVDVVINPKTSLLTADFEELKAEVARAFQLIEKTLSQPNVREQMQ
jgi:ribonuclease P protein component